MTDITPKRDKGDDDALAEIPETDRRSVTTRADAHRHSSSRWVPDVACHAEGAAGRGEGFHSGHSRRVSPGRARWPGDNIPLGPQSLAGSRAASSPSAVGRGPSGQLAETGTSRRASSARCRSISALREQCPDPDFEWVSSDQVLQDLLLDEGEAELGSAAGQVRRAAWPRLKSRRERGAGGGIREEDTRRPNRGRWRRVVLRIGRSFAGMRSSYVA